MITEWTNRTQRATLATATRNGEGWTSADLAFVTAFAPDTTDADIALALGRTLYAIQTIRHAIDAGRATGSTRTTTTRAYVGWVEGMGDGDE